MQLFSSEGVEVESPFLQGHFPENPIVPGAILLGYSSQALLDLGYEIRHVQRMKFLRPLGPKQPFKIIFEKGDAISKLSWYSSEGLMVNARVELRSIDG